MTKYKYPLFSLTQIIIFLFIVNIHYGQTDVGGKISTSTTWTKANSPYNLLEDLYIRDGATLTIEDGVTVNFKNRYIFVGYYQSAKLIANDVIFTFGTIQFNKESNGTISNSEFRQTHLSFEEFSVPDISGNRFDETSKVFFHSPDAIPNFNSNNTFDNGEIHLSGDIDINTELIHFKNCIYKLDGDLYLINDAELTIHNSVSFYMMTKDIYIGFYSNAKILADGVDFYWGNINLTDNSVGTLSNCNFSWVNFSLADSTELTISNSNLDSNSTINNNSTNVVEASDNYWGRPRGPIINDGSPTLTGEVNYRPFSKVKLNTTTDIEENLEITDYKLLQNYPNPFNPSTKIEFLIPNDGSNFVSSTKTTLTIYDILGRKIQTLVSEYLNSGNYVITFDAAELSGGVYFYKLHSGNFSETKKMILMK